MKIVQLTSQVVAGVRASTPGNSQRTSRSPTPAHELFGSGSGDRSAQPQPRYPLPMYQGVHIVQGIMHSFYAFLLHYSRAFFITLLIIYYYRRYEIDASRSTSQSTVAVCTSTITTCCSRLSTTVPTAFLFVEYLRRWYTNLV